ncbi:MAG: hypothetical protein R3F19_07000 [Verrucomicrobiales bacterium]
MPDDIFRVQIHRLIDRGNHTYSDVVDQAKRAIKALDARAVPFVLDYHPWTKQCWDEVVGPYLESHVSEENMVQMLDVLEFDPRIGDIMITRGWEEQAIPGLKQHLIDGHLLPMPCMIALAKLEDPALGPHFQREFPGYSDMSNSNLGVLGELVRAHPVCDWSKAVTEGWKRRKYGLVSDYTGENYFAFWAAEQGDIDALRLLAEYAAGENSISREWAQRKIATLLVDLLPADAHLVNWLRENVDRFQFSPAAGGYEISW